jgi:hypothetical protein
LRGASKVIGGETYEIVVALNGFLPEEARATAGTIRIKPIPGDKNLVLLTVDSPINATIEWSLSCN